MDNTSEIRLAEFENRLRALESGQDEQQGQNAQLPGFVPIPQLTEDTPIPWDIRINETNEVEVYSPTACVTIEYSSSNPKRKHLKHLILDGAEEGKWFKTSTYGVDSRHAVVCRLNATVSASGSIDYSIITSGSGSGADVQAVLIGWIETDSETGKKSVIQLRRGELSFLGIGIHDTTSVMMNDAGQLEIKGFKSQASEETKLAQHLKAETEFEGQVLVRTEDENGKKELKFVPIGNGLNGGGGDTTGYTGTVNVPTGEMRCNSASGYYIQNEYKTWTFENGLLKSVSDTDQWTTGLPTLEVSTLPQS